MKIIQILATGFAMFILATGVEAGCVNSIPVTTPTTRFIVNGDGTVSDTYTGLMWMRCSLGQTWDGTTCTGTAAQYQWADALTQAQSSAFATYTDWRLPSVKELVSIVERSCANPSVNSTIFPATPTWYFWTNSPSVSGSGTNVHVVAFGQGFDTADAKTNVDPMFHYHVRLVRVAH
jgi:hypothetical protein